MTARINHDWSTPLTEAEIEQLKLSFESMATYKPDAAGGTIDVVKYHVNLMLETGFRRSLEELQVFVDYLDNKNGGILTWNEHIETLKVFYDPEATVTLQARTFDLNGDGFITADEFQSMGPPLGVYDTRI